MGWLTTDKARRGAGLLLAALALAIRLAAPQGWMLGQDGHGALRMVICTGHGPAELADLAGKSPARGPGKSSEHPCVAAGHTVSLAPTHTALASNAAAYEIRPDPPRLIDQRPGRGLAAPPPPSHAPPPTA